MFFLDNDDDTFSVSANDAESRKKQGCKRKRRCISPVYYSVSIRGKEIPACFLAFFSVVASSSNLSTSIDDAKLGKNQ